MAVWLCLHVWLCVLPHANRVGCRGHGLLHSVAPSRRTKQRRSSAKTPEIKDQVQDRALFQEAGSVLLVQGVWVLKKVSGAFVCSMPPHPAPLKSACFCPLHNLIEFFEQLIRMHFVSKRVGEGGRQKCPHPEFHRRATGRPTWLATGGNDGHERAKSIASMHVFELWQLFANLMTMAGRSRIPLRPRTLWWSSLCCQLPRWEKREWVEEEKLFVSWNLIFFCDFINFDYLHFAVISVWVNVHTVCLRWINAITWHDLNSKKSWNALRCKTSYFHILWTVEQTFQLRSLYVYSVHLDVAFSLSDHITASASADCRSHDDQN